MQIEKEKYVMHHREKKLKSQIWKFRSLMLFRFNIADLMFALYLILSFEVFMQTHEKVSESQQLRQHTFSTICTHFCIHVNIYMYAKSRCTPFLQRSNQIFRQILLKTVTIKEKDCLKKFTYDSETLSRFVFFRVFHSFSLLVEWNFICSKRAHWEQN